MTNSAQFRLGYFPELDGLRAVAVLLVFCHHAGIAWVGGGQIGVDIFFVLSGFLITTLLMSEIERTGTINIGRFLIRRVLRLMPAFLALLAAYILLAVATKSGAELRSSLFVAAFAGTYLGDIAMSYVGLDMRALSHTWSLAIEERYYLVYPAIMFLLVVKYKNAEAFITLLIGLTLAIVLNRSLIWGPDIAEISRAFYSFDAHTDGLFIGCLTGIYVVRNGLPKVAVTMCKPAGIVLLFFILFAEWNTALYGYGLIAINLAATAFILGVLATRPTILSNSVLVWTGRISYGLYLWHHLVFVTVRDKFTNDPLLILLIGAAGSFVMATISYYVIEMPFLRLKRHFREEPSIPPNQAFENSPARA